MTKRTVPISLSSELETREAEFWKAKKQALEQAAQSGRQDSCLA